MIDDEEDFVDDNYDDYAEQFCQHWNESDECEELCQCGHSCKDHSVYDGECMVGNCECWEFESEV
jgi:hypothetical protein